MRVAEVWPEFGSRGKEQITLRHVLMHTAGLPGLPPATTAEDLCDWDRMCAALAAQELWWEPGTRFGYHALTFGFLLGEIMRRATDRTVTALLRELLTGPLGVPDEVCFAVPPALLPRWRGRCPVRCRIRRSPARPWTGPCPPVSGPVPNSRTASTCSPPTSRPWAL